MIQDAMEKAMKAEDSRGPDFEDGHDCEGFSGGCKRMGCLGGDNCIAAKQKPPTGWMDTNTSVKEDTSGTKLSG